MGFACIDDVRELSGKTVLVRADLNVPFADGKVSDLTRIDALKPTVADLRAKGAKVVLLSHFGRPKDGPSEEFSLKRVLPALEAELGERIAFGDDCIGAKAQAAIASGADVVLLENLRFHAGEEKNDPAFVAELAKLGDLYVNDAFSCAHRAHASTEGIAHKLPSYAGRSMEGELKALEAALGSPKRPVAAIVGGAKVSTKIAVLKNLTARVDHLIIGGGMANTFLAARGIDVGSSLCERDFIGTAQEIAEAAKANNCAIHLPADLVVATEFKPHAENRICGLHDVRHNEMILDAGPETIAVLGTVLKSSRTLIWNGPLGAFEMPPFDRATLAVAHMAADLTAAGALTSVAGGGDTVAALAAAGVKERFSHVSTAGGAFLEWMEGAELPGVKALER